MRDRITNNIYNIPNAIYIFTDPFFSKPQNYTPLIVHFNYPHLEMEISKQIHV